MQGAGQSSRPGDTALANRQNAPKDARGHLLAPSYCFTTLAGTEASGSMWPVCSGKGSRLYTEGQMHVTVRHWPKVAIWLSTTTKDT
jgi:hypothetical protein